MIGKSTLYPTKLLYEIVYILNPTQQFLVSVTNNIYKMNLQNSIVQRRINTRSMTNKSTIVVRRVNLHVQVLDIYYYLIYYPLP